MVILCTALAMAAPSLRGFFSSRQTSQAAAQIVALTKLARTQAICQGRVYRLNIDTDERSYWLTAQQQGTFDELESAFGRTFYLPRDVTVELDEITGASLAQDYIEFFPQGQTQASIIRLTDRRGEILEITCFSPTELFTVIRREQI